MSGLERHRSFRHNTHGVVSDADADAVIEAVYDREHADDIGGCSYRADQSVSDGFPLPQRLPFLAVPSSSRSIPPDTPPPTCVAFGSARFIAKSIAAQRFCHRCRGEVEFFHSGRFAQ